MITAIARPTPNWRRLATSARPQARKTPSMLSAAPVTTRAVRASPTWTAWAASPLRSHSSRTRLTMNTW